MVTLKGPYPPGTPIDAGYITFLLACGAAALHPSMASVATLETTPTPLRPRWRLVLLGGAAILAPAVQMLEWMRGRPIEVPVVAAASIVMFLLIVARTQGLTRQVTVQDERRRLLGRVLQAAEDERTRIAHDLHDGPVQQLAVLNYDIYRAASAWPSCWAGPGVRPWCATSRRPMRCWKGWRMASARRCGCCAT